MIHRALAMSLTLAWTLALACSGSSGPGLPGDMPGPGAPDGAPGSSDASMPPSYPEPGAWGPSEGPGGPQATFTQEQLYQNCAYLDGGSQDVLDHHNLVTMYDGWLLMPWSPETGTGGLSFFDISSPCSPVERGSGYSGKMRESHSIGFSQHGGSWAVTDGIDGTLVATKGGVLFWDISDTTAPTAVKLLNLPGFLYPDAYDRVTLSVFWQVPYVFAGGGDNGVYVIDATNPLEPELVKQITFEPVMRVGQVQAIGNLLIVTTAEQPRTVLLDISDPTNPKPIAGGDFLAKDAPDGSPKEAYFTNTSGGFVYYARKEGAGGLIVYDIRNPSAPSWAGVIPSDGNGGYVFIHEGLAFSGESSFAAIYDVTDHANMSEIQRLHLEGDLDTITPIGNMAVLSVDEDSVSNQATALAPWKTTPDDVPPVVDWVWPADGASVPLGSRFGVGLNEMVEVKSAWEGSVRLYEKASGRKVDGYISAQEHLVNFVPKAPLSPNTDYVFEIPAGGLTDTTGNAIAVPFRAEFRTRGS